MSRCICAGGPIVVEHLRDGRVVEEAVFHRLKLTPG